MRARGGQQDWQYLLAVKGALAVGDDKASLYTVIGQNCLAYEAYAIVRNAPTGAAITLEIERSPGNPGSWSTVVSSVNLQIAAAANVGSTTVLAITQLNKNDILRLNIDQIGSVVAGDDLTVFLRVKKMLP